jgi:hypothetical protein
MAAGIINAIKHDHCELDAYYDCIVKSVDADEQTRYQNQLTWELARHSIGEELVVERYVDGGAELARKDREEHQKANKSSQPVEEENMR